MKILNKIFIDSCINFTYSQEFPVPSEGFIIYSDIYNRPTFGIKDLHKSFLNFNNLTGDREYIFPNFSGTLLLTDSATIPNNRIPYTSSGGVVSFHPPFSEGNIPFFDQNGLLKEDDSFFWDSKNKKLGINKRQFLRAPINTLIDRRNDILTTGDITNGSNVIENVINISSIKEGMEVVGYGIPNDTYVVSLDASNNEITISRSATETQTDVELFFNYYITKASDFISYIKETYNGPNNFLRFKTATVNSSNNFDYPKSSNILGGISFYVWDTSKNTWHDRCVASIKAVAANDHDNNSKPTRIVISVNRNNSTISKDTWMFNEYGDLQSINTGGNYGTTETDSGFICLQTINGTPTSTPSSYSSVSSPLVLDSFKRRIWVYNGGAWRIFSDGIVSENAFVNNGNSFGTDAYIGLNDSNKLYFKTNGILRGYFRSNGHGLYIGDPTIGGSSFLTLSDDINDEHGILINNKNDSSSSSSFVELKTGVSTNRHLIRSHSSGTTNNALGVVLSNKMELTTNRSLLIHANEEVYIGNSGKPFSSLTIKNGKISVNKNTEATTTLDIHGDFSLSRVLEISHSTVYNVLNVEGYSVIIVGLDNSCPACSGTTTINGMSGGVDGKIVWIYNNTDSSIIINNNFNNNDYDFDIGVNGNTIIPKTAQAFIYIGKSIKRWRVFSNSPRTNPINGDNFSGSLNRLVYSNGTLNVSTLNAWTNVDNTNQRLKIGNNLAPTATLHVVGSLRTDLGSDADYDMYYRGTSGNFERIPIASNGSFLVVSSGIPSWGNKIKELIIENDSYNKWYDSSVITNNNDFTTLFSIIVPNNTVLQIEADVLGVRTGGTAGDVGDSASYKRYYKVTNIAGSVTVNNVSTTVTHESKATWDINDSVSGNTFMINVKGANNNIISWRGIVRIQQSVSF